MNYLAVIVRPGHVQELQILLDVAFMLYTLVSFVRVLAYVVEQTRAGNMIGGVRAPLRWTIPEPAAWLFIAGVLLLLFDQSAFYYLLVVIGISMFLIVNRHTAAEQFGFSRLPFGKLLKWSLFICGAFVFIELPLAKLVEIVMNTAHLPNPEEESVQIFRKITHQPAQVILFLIEAAFVAPLIEELFFRGFLFTFLKNYTSTWAALILSSGVFAFAHFSLGSAIQLWVLGFILGLAYENSGSLLLSMGIHACWNLLAALSILLDQGSF